MRKWDKPDNPGVMITRRQLLLGIGVLTAMAVLMAVGFTPRSADAPDISDTLTQVGSDAAAHLAENCKVIQHLTYAPCGHAMTRRQSLPQELIGKTRADAETAYEPFRITGFAPEELEMEQSLDMFCPEHVVLMPNESGVLCIFENRYGDALALVRELETLLKDLPDSYQEELLPGKGFDTLTELEGWLESIES